MFDGLGQGDSVEGLKVDNAWMCVCAYMNKNKNTVKLYGDVPTPPALVKDMLDKLPKKVWSNPNKRWLDPCVGIGAFVEEIVKRLMEGLMAWEPDDSKRYKHIMENMIYVCELQPNHVAEFRVRFAREDVKLNIFEGSYLSEEFNKWAEG